MGSKDGLFSLLLFCLHRVIIHELDEAPRVLVGMYRADLSEAVRHPLLDMVWYDMITDMSTVIVFKMCADRVR